MVLHERIRQRRLEKGMNAIELAREADISKGYMSELESGRAPRPSGAVLMRLAAALGTTIADLLERDAEPLAVKVSEQLQKFADDAELPKEDLQMLAQIRFRGAQPTSVDDWRYLYESIKRSMPRGS